ncbi:polyamine N-acetyltransferase [Schizosaccharomyces cryophilus OY26]|uniref:Polyamine N-acetyltransferase n=1 Tax=Schizosaccharomyces cryophilus (strain OY26 / ATCC MYA-4695 / CBS 11777 / NBRC 106824 / NRRL Y48691) TaxID=653667 RepID=S9XB42_SCHCR|nr:polyamine N-acetyltransferase [Schizosaccharomyces cryophilus OY26]EPY50966.1 polyamine N-acetyltransferase [Schizosaccharomyces cryophilus OY26]
MVNIRNIEKSETKQVAHLEDMCFPENERASLKTIAYRVSQAPELQLGLFAPTEHTTTLIGHLMATRTSSESVTVDSMSKHEPKGKNVAIHSLSVHPAHRGRGYAKQLIKELQFRCETTVSPKPRIMTLLAHKPLISLYEEVGFKLIGESACKFGGDTWYDMVYEI